MRTSYFCKKHSSAVMRCTHVHNVLYAHTHAYIYISEFAFISISVCSLSSTLAIGNYFSAISYVWCIIRYSFTHSKYLCLQQTVLPWYTVSQHLVEKKTIYEIRMSILHDCRSLVIIVMDYCSLTGSYRDIAYFHSFYFPIACRFRSCSSNNGPICLYTL